MAKYKDIVNQLIEELDANRFKVGDRFYSEAEICQRFKVSSTTAVKVLNELENKNRVTRIQGKGTFVAKEEHHRLAYFTDLNMAKGRAEDVKVLSVKRGNEPKILAKLHLIKDDNYICIKRLRFIGNQVSQYSINYINANYIDLKEPFNLDDFRSVYNRIRIDSKIDPYQLPFKQNNIAKSLSDLDILKYFKDVDESSIFIHQHRYTMTPLISNEVMEYAVSYKLPQYWGYSVEALSGLK